MTLFIFLKWSQWFQIVQMFQMVKWMNGNLPQYVNWVKIRKYGTVTTKML